MMRQYYGKVKGKKTLVYTSPLTGRQTSLVRSCGRKSLYKLKCDYIDVDTRKHPWMNYSASVGRSPWQREEVKAEQHGQCAQCGAAITEVHHRSAREPEGQRESIWIRNDESGPVSCLSRGTHTKASTEQEPTGKAEYSERGPLSLREHGGETYSL